MLMAKKNKQQNILFKHLLIDVESPLGFSNNFTLSLVALIMLCIGLVGGYLLWSGKGIPNSDEKYVDLKPNDSSPSPLSLGPSSEISSEWKRYTNAKIGFSINYPKALTVYEMPSGVRFFKDPSVIDTPLMDDDYFGVNLYDFKLIEFVPLFEASIGSDVPEAHKAVSVKITKLKNSKIKGYDVVEYIHDGVTVPMGDLGRGPIGYSHILLIKIAENKYLQIANNSMDPEITKQRDSQFAEIVKSLDIY